MINVSKTSIFQFPENIHKDYFKNKKHLQHQNIFHMPNIEYNDKFFKKIMEFLEFLAFICYFATHLPSTKKILTI